MRVLVVDQDSASNLGVTRSLRDLYTVDCVTNKAACLDLLRSNPFEVIVATERLEDGSGLELLGQISKKWPSVLRIFAADRERLQLLRGRLGPFELFQTLAYPFDPQKLLATLQRAAAAHGCDRREVELPSAVPEEPEESTDAARTSAGEPGQSSAGGPGESPAESPTGTPFEISALNQPLNLEQPDEFSEPRFARAGRAEPVQASSSGRRRSVASRVGSVSGLASASGTSRGSGARRTRRFESTQPENDLAAKFPGSGTLGPRRGADGASSRPSRSSHERSAPSKGLPVRFPPLNRTLPVERTTPVERIPSLESAPARNAGTDFSEAATLARASRSHYESSPEELGTKRLAPLIGGGVAVAVVVLFLGFKLFGSKGETSKPAAPPLVSHAPEYSPEVTLLVAQTEDAFKADDFESARANVERLRQLSPLHPRLEFFQGLLSGAHSSVSGRGTGVATVSSSKKRKKSDPATRVAESHSDASPRSDTASAAAPAMPTGAAAPTGVAAPAAPYAEATGLLAEAPVAMTRDAEASAQNGKVSTAGAAEVTTAAASSGPVVEPGAAASDSGSATGTSAAQATNTATAPTTATTSASTSRRGAGEPPPVVQEAKLIRRVNPDYPSAARKDGIAGSVDLEITVSPQGVVENASVLQATPPDVFEKAAVAAVRKWKYDPRFVDGLPAQAHLKVHLEFGRNK